MPVVILLKHNRSSENNFCSIKRSEFGARMWYSDLPCYRSCNEKSSSKGLALPRIKAVLSQYFQIFHNLIDLDSQFLLRFQKL